MKKLALLSAAALFAMTHAGLADEKPTAEEAAKIKEAVSALGCEGGEYEKEAEGSGVYEVDDAKCKDGQYDIKLDSNFKMRSMTRD